MTSSFAGRLAGRIISSYLGRQASSVVEAGKSLSDPLTKAMIDSYIMEKVTAAIWPPMTILMALILLRQSSTLISLDVLRFTVGTVVLVGLAWSTCGTLSGVAASWPHIRFWSVTRLSPKKHVRLILYRLLLEHQQRQIRDIGSSGSFAQALVHAAIENARNEHQISPERAAFDLANHITGPAIWHGLSRITWGLLPILGALTYYRFSIYPALVQGDAGMGPWQIAFYPISVIAHFIITHCEQIVFSALVTIP